MTTRLRPKTAMATLAAVGLCIPLLGLPLPEACAAPSPSCGGDLRECLRASADRRQTTFGGRYVTADDVARCMEAFNACIHGGASRGGNPVPPTSTPQRGSGSGSLPQRFTMRFSSSGSTFASDCQVSGDSVSCTSTVQPLPPDIVDYQASFTGSLSGMTLTGTEVSRQEVHYETGCISREEYSRPYTYVFDPGGSVTAKIGTGQRKSTFTCDEPTSGSTPGGEVTGTWSSNG